MMSIVLKDNTIKVKGALNDVGVAWLREACGEVEAQVKRNTKVLSGNTKGSWQYKVDASKMEGYVGSNLENAIWEEFGTGEFALEGNGRKGGWFYVDAKGRRHFTKGKKPRRALHKAFTALKSKLQAAAKAKFGGIG